MMEKIPLALILQNGVVGSPTNHRSKNHTLISEWAVTVVTNSIAQHVAITSGIREVVLAIVLVHPRCFEETMWVICLERITFVIHDDDWTWSLSKVETILGETHATTWQSIVLSFRELWSLKMDIVLVTLKLSAPKSTEIDIYLTIIVLECAHVDAVATRDWC